eukprot:1580323-Ditylum_brightwellii.AAC.1
MAVNDLTEHSFGGLSSQLQVYGHIGLGNVGSLSQICINGDLSHGYERGSHNNKTDNSMSVKREGILHLLSDEMRKSLLMVAMKDALAARKSGQAALLMQQEARQCKEKLAKEHALALAAEEYIHAHYYFDMYGSEACWKTDAIVGVEYTPAQLALHLNIIIEQEGLHNIHDNPPAFLSTQKVLPNLGLETVDVSALDKICASGLTEFEHKARTVRLECEAAGFGDCYAEMQSDVQPNVDEHLIGCQLEICSKYDLENGKETCVWHQGIVLAISDGINMAKISHRSAMIKR